MIKDFWPSGSEVIRERAAACCSAAPWRTPSAGCAKGKICCGNRAGQGNPASQSDFFLEERQASALVFDHGVAFRQFRRGVFGIAGKVKEAGHLPIRARSFADVEVVGFRGFFADDAEGHDFFGESVCFYGSDGRIASTMAGWIPFRAPASEREDAREGVLWPVFLMKCP